MPSLRLLAVRLQTPLFNVALPICELVASSQITTDATPLASVAVTVMVSDVDRVRPETDSVCNVTAGGVVSTVTVVRSVVLVWLPASSVTTA